MNYLIPGFSKSFIRVTDESDIVVGLFHFNRVLKILSILLFISQGSYNQQKYWTIEKDVLALLQTIEHF